MKVLYSSFFFHYMGLSLLAGVLEMNGSVRVHLKTGRLQSINLQTTSSAMAVSIFISLDRYFKTPHTVERDGTYSFAFCLK